MKIEPNADLRQAAASMWEMFVALTDAGFSESQALTIMGHVLSMGTKNND